MKQFQLYETISLINFGHQNCHMMGGQRTVTVSSYSYSSRYKVREVNLERSLGDILHIIYVYTWTSLLLLVASHAVEIFHKYELIKILLLVPLFDSLKRSHLTPELGSNDQRPRRPSSRHNAQSFVHEHHSRKEGNHFLHAIMMWACPERPPFASLSFVAFWAAAASFATEIVHLAETRPQK